MSRAARDDDQLHIILYFTLHVHLLVTPMQNGAVSRLMPESQDTHPPLYFGRKTWVSEMAIRNGTAIQSLQINPDSEYLKQTKGAHALVGPRIFLAL